MVLSHSHPSYSPHLPPYLWLLPLLPRLLGVGFRRAADSPDPAARGSRARAAAIDGRGAERGRTRRVSGGRAGVFGVLCVLVLVVFVSFWTNRMCIYIYI